MASTLPAGQPVTAAAPPSSATHYRAAAYALVAAFGVVNLVYLFAFCPYDLAPDEAHYWDWSRKLDWSYYSKGPLVAWLIRAGVELFGDLAIQITGTAMPAVRLPAVIAYMLMTLAVHQLTRQTFRDEKLAFWTIALALTVPPFAAPAVIMTIDGPYLCCWAWAAVFAQRAVLDGGLGSWAAAGLVSAVGLLAKYNMVVFPASVGAFLLLTPGRWRELLRPGFWVMAGLMVLGLLPIAIWNAQHEWVGLRHVLALTGFSPENTAAPEPLIDPEALPHFLLGQLGLLIGYWFIAWVAAMVAFRPWRADPAVAFLWWASLPIWLIFFVAGVKSKGQPNWPAAAYLTGFVLAVAWVVRQVGGPPSGYRAVARFWLGFAVVFGLTFTVLARVPGLLRPTLATFVATPSETEPAPVRRLDPTARLSGWRTLAERVDELRAKVAAEEGVEPLVAAMTWNQPGELGFYCKGHPEVYSFGPAIADRHSQYDVWRPNPVADAQVFRGRTFVYVGDYNLSLRLAFDRADPPVEVIASDGGIPIAEWKVWVLRGFKGFPITGQGRKAY